MSEQENAQLVQLAYRNFQSGDVQSVLGSLSEDIEWVVPQIEGVPIGGTYRGVEEVGQFFSGLGNAQEPRQFEPREFVSEGETVVALGHYAWHVNSTGREWESDFAHVFITCAKGRLHGSKNLPIPLRLEVLFAGVEPITTDYPRVQTQLQFGRSPYSHTLCAGAPTLLLSLFVWLLRGLTSRTSLFAP